MSESTPKPGMPWRKAKLGMGGCCLFAGLVLVALGILLPVVVDDMVKKGVTKLAILDPEKFSESAAANWINQTTHQDFYLYNCTNLFAVLTSGATPNFQEVGPIRTRRYPYRYNVSWDTPNSQVSFNQVTMYDVIEEDRWYLRQPIIAVNAFYLGLNAQVMTSVVGAVNNALAGGVPQRPVSRFPGGYLSEQQAVLGFLGSEVVPGFIKGAFVGNDSALIMQLRNAGTIFYAGVVEGTIAALVGGGYPTSRDEVLSVWANNTVKVPGLRLSAYNPSMFYGFELDTPLQTVNYTVVAKNLWNTAHPYSLFSEIGLHNWAIFAAKATPCFVTGNPATCGALYPDLVAIATSLQIDLPAMANDIQSIAFWLKKFSVDALPGTTIGNAYEKTVCTAISGVIHNYRLAYPTSPFTLAYTANEADYLPQTWLDVGALQFGTGIILGVLTQSELTLKNGTGISLSTMSPTATLNALAAEPEPFEFTAGIRYYISHRLKVPPSVSATWPTGADQYGLWGINSALLWSDKINDVLINLNIAQTKILFNRLLTDVTTLGKLVAELQVIVGKYAEAFLPVFVLGNQATWGPAIMGATIAANNEMTAASLRTSSLFNKTDIQILITPTNYYAVWSYLYNYLGQELSGPLSQIDSMGIAPQNTGLFMRLTVHEMLFGQKISRFGPKAVAPAIAGVEFGAKPLSQVLSEDYNTHLGRTYITNTGHADLDKVGEWIEYEGVAKYQYNCDLVDPRRRMKCATPSTEFANNFKIWGANATIAGSGSSAQIGPFKEGDKNRPNKLLFYVDELKKVVTLEYKGDSVIKGITMRRYGLYNTLIDSNYTIPNPDKNDEVWYQGTGKDVVPVGLFGLSTVNGGLPVYVSLPYFGLSKSGEINPGVTCNNIPCSENYEPEEHDTHLDVEPLTGITMNGAKRLQANFRVTAHEFYTGAYTDAAAGGTVGSGYPAKLPAGFPNMISTFAGTNNPGGLTYMWNHLFGNGRETIYLPYYWADLHDVIDDNDSSKFRKAYDSIKMARAAASGMRVAGIIVGVIVAIASIGVIAWLLKAGPNAKA